MGIHHEASAKRAPLAGIHIRRFGTILLLFGITILTVGPIMVGAVYSEAHACQSACNNSVLVPEYYGGMALAYVGTVAVPLGLVLLIAVSNRKALLGVLGLFLLLFVFLAPVVQTSVPDFVIGEYANSCWGVFGLGPLPWSGISASISFILLHREYGLVYVPAGMPPLHNSSLVFFPPVGEKPLMCI